MDDPAGHQPSPDLEMSQLGINHTGPNKASIVPGHSNESARHQPYWAG